MSILIKNKKMPKCCVTCWAAEICRYYDKFSNCERPEHCPMVEVPEPHGRLVDREEISVDIYEDADGFHYEVSAPTVIEAEK